MEALVHCAHLHFPHGYLKYSMETILNFASLAGSWMCSVQFDPNVFIPPNDECMAHVHTPYSHSFIYHVENEIKKQKPESEEEEDRKCCIVPALCRQRTNLGPCNTRDVVAYSRARS